MEIFNTPQGILLFIIGIISIMLIFGIISFLILSHILYTMHLKRTKKTKWTRKCSCDDPNQVRMYEEGLAWSAANKAFKKDLHIVNDRLNLYAEYYDFGFDRAVIIIPGRSEALGYGYYFAPPYAEHRFNILTIDQRAHGESDGKYSTIGFEEHKDLLCWAKLLHDEHKVKSILLHGICIGSSCSLMLLTSDSCPNYINGLVAEGMYTTFWDNFKNHMIVLKKPVFPALQLVDMWMRLYTGHSMRYGNIDIMKKMKKPLLMLHSKEDLFSLPEGGAELYELCPHENKKMVWFEHGDHSMLRITDTSLYDTSIIEFIKEYFPEKQILKSSSK